MEQIVKNIPVSPIRIIGRITAVVLTLSVPVFLFAGYVDSAFNCAVGVLIIYLMRP